MAILYIYNHGKLNSQKLGDIPYISSLSTGTALPRNHPKLVVWPWLTNEYLIATAIDRVDRHILSLVSLLNWF